jgi:hypothetical protein
MAFNCKMQRFNNNRKREYAHSEYVKSCSCQIFIFKDQLDDQSVLGTALHVTSHDRISTIVHC